MENDRIYKSNPYLIGLLAIGGVCVIVWVLSKYVLNTQTLTFDLNSLEISFITLLFLVVILVSSQLVYIDALKINAGEAFPHQKTFRSKTWTPVSWAVLTLVFWIIFFPFYLFNREDIYWRNISVDYHTLKTIERDINLQVQRQPSQPSPENKKYLEHVGICPRCETPYPLKRLERSKFCARCGELLKKE